MDGEDRADRGPAARQVNRRRALQVGGAAGLGAMVGGAIAVGSEDVNRAGAVGALDASEFGVSPDNPPDLNSRGLRAAFAAAIKLGVECYIGPGVYAVESGLVWDAPIVRLRGAGSQASVLRFADNRRAGLTVGTGSSPSDLGQQGWVKNLGVDSAGSGPAPNNGCAAVVISSIRFGLIDNLYLRGFDVGLDLINNNYGTLIQQVHSRYGACNLALRIRSSFESGNDLLFLNCWLDGRRCAVSVEPDAATGADGFHFIGGQLSAGAALEEDQDDLGVITVGRDWQTGGVSPGEASRITLTATTFEGFKSVWAVRLHKPTVALVLRDVVLTSTATSGDTTAPLGFLKHSLPYNDVIRLDGVSFGYGAYKRALFELSPNPGASPTYIEQGTSGRPTVDGEMVDLFVRGLFDRVGLIRGIALSGGAHSVLMLDGLRLRSNDGVLETSTDGVHYLPLR